MTNQPSASGREVLRHLRWPLTRRLGQQVPGDAGSRRVGPGIEYADVREYVAGEDARLIDWNLTARSDRPYVRESHPDRGLDVWFIVDASRSLDWGTSRALKRDAAMDLVMMASTVLARHGSRVGAMVFDTRLRRVMALASGREARLHLLSSLGREVQAPGEPGPTDLAGALRRASRLVRRPSLVFVVSDFIAEPGWQRPLKAMGLRHDVVAVLVTDPREAELPMVGVVTLEDPETGRQVEVDTTGRRFRERYRSAAAEKRALLMRDFRQAQAEVLELTTADPVLRQLVDYIEGRRARHRGRPAPRAPQPPLMRASHGATEPRPLVVLS